MKLQIKSDETSSFGAKFGIVCLGPALGKAFVEIDRNGESAAVYAFAYDAVGGRSHGKFVHYLLWEMHFGGIAPGLKVTHRNGITMDNRLDNLVLRPASSKIWRTSDPKNAEDSLYWSAVERMPREVVPIHIKLLSIQEQSFYTDSHRYFECHYPPCTKIEQKPQEFSICSLCHVTRYCGPACQARDWPWHKTVCFRPTLKEVQPDR